MPNTNGIVYFNGSNIETAAAGTSGQYMKSQGSGGAPVMAALSGPISGITDASNAASGIIGEVISANIAVGSAVTLTSNAYSDITNITLTAGDWNIYGSIGFTGGAITGTRTLAFIGTASGNNTTGQDLSKNTIASLLVPTAVTDIIMPLPYYRVNNNGSVTYYLKAFSVFTIGTVTAYGTIEARRIR